MIQASDIHRQYRDEEVLAISLRRVCADCAECLSDAGFSCAAHSTRCQTCGSYDVARAGRMRESGISEWFCETCWRTAELVDPFAKLIEAAETAQAVMFKGTKSQRLAEAIEAARKAWTPCRRRK